MSDQNQQHHDAWYIYQNGQQLGPFGSEQVKQLYSNHMISHEAYLYKVGWKDWRPLEESHEELGLSIKDTPASEGRRAGAPRASIQGRVVVHNNGQLAIGSGVNISSTGIFVETSDKLFREGETLKLSVRCDGINKPFNVVAQVIRFANDARYPIGYGLQFETIDPGIRSEIETLVNLQNQSHHSKSSVS